MLTGLNAADIVRYKRDGKRYVIWSVEAKEYSSKVLRYTEAHYALMPKSIYDALDPGNPDTWGEEDSKIYAIPESDLELIEKAAALD